MPTRLTLPLRGFPAYPLYPKSMKQEQQEHNHHHPYNHLLSVPSLAYVVLFTYQRLLHQFRYSGNQTESEYERVYNKQKLLGITHKNSVNERGGRHLTNILFSSLVPYIDIKFIQ